MKKVDMCGRCGEEQSTHDTSPRCRYNGWKNYETWCVKLWIDNEQGTYRTACGMAQDAKLDANPDKPRDAVWRLEKLLKEWVEIDILPDLGATLAADMLGAAMQEVDWVEIAEAYLED